MALRLISSMNHGHLKMSGKFGYVNGLKCILKYYIIQRASQEEIPPDVNGIPSLPLGLIIWTDKSQLSTFGTVKGYPVLARLSALPHHICNASRSGGACLIGLLPAVSPFFAL